jgi:hypothetical protein
VQGPFKMKINFENFENAFWLWRGNSSLIVPPPPPNLHLHSRGFVCMYHQCIHNLCITYNVDIVVEHLLLLLLLWLPFLIGQFE